MRLRTIITGGLAFSLLLGAAALRAEDGDAADAKFASRERLADATGRPDLVAGLSDEQVFAFNRALNDSISNGLIDTIDRDALAEAMTADLDPRQIQLLTHGLEQEARFALQAERFEQRYADTDKEHFLDHAARARATGERERDKFFDKATATADAELREHAQQRAALAAREAARERARDDARKRAREAAREEAKLASKEAAKERGKEQRRE